MQSVSGTASHAFTRVCSSLSAPAVEQYMRRRRLHATARDCMRSAPTRDTCESS